MGTLQRARRRDVMEWGAHDVSKLKPLVLKMSPSMSRIVTPLWMTTKVQICVFAVLLQRNQRNFSSSPFSMCLPTLCPLIFPKVIMSLMSLPPED